MVRAGHHPHAGNDEPRKSVGTAYLAYSGRLLAEVADALGKSDDAANYRDTAANAVKAYRAAFTENGVIHSDRQCEYVRAIAFALLGEEESKAAAETLNRMVAENDYHLNTGFLSTPFLCDVLAKYGYADTAYKLLLQPDAPGWLYEVRCGATTMWERWDSVRPDGSFDESGMNSFNHYAFGAVGDWLLEQLVGIRPAEPGYRAITLQPQLIQGITQACALRTTPYGRVRLAWQCLNHLITVEVEIPANTTAQLFLPEQEDLGTMLSRLREQRYG